MPTAAQLIDAARREIGTVESPPGSNRQPYAARAGHANGAPWCATFVVACARAVGLQLPSESAYCPTMAAAFRAAGRWSSTPVPGAVVFFAWPGDTVIDHVGIVEAVAADGSVTTIEGNTDVAGSGNGGQVMRKTRRGSIAGYGLPDFGAAVAAAASASRYPGVTRPGDGMPPKAPSEITKAYQRGLIAAGYLSAGDDDGRHGPATAAAIRKLEGDRGLTVDAGAGGPQVWGALGGAPGVAR